MDSDLPRLRREVLAAQLATQVIGLNTDFSGDRALQETLNLLDRDAVDHRPEEAFDDQLLRFGDGMPRACR